VRQQVRRPFAQGVAVQVVNLKKQRLETSFFHFSGSRVETRRFQATGQLDSTCTAPTKGDHAVTATPIVLHAVAAQVEFESKR
jgi:hypothetical protein